MSEYQYYKFQAIDRPLGQADLEALRALSTRARITATSFTNTYEWGNFKGDPTMLMERWFDLHLYLANWGKRRLMIRLPKRLVDRRQLGRFLRKVDCAGLRVSGENLIFDIQREEMEAEDWEDGSGWLAALAPLRTDVLQGDLRLFYLLWLTAVEADAIEADELEPMPGIGPATATLEAFAEFIGLDPDLVQAAAELPVKAAESAISTDTARRLFAAMTEREKAEMLMRAFDGDPHVAVELRVAVRDHLGGRTDASSAATRTVGELRARARSIRLARERARSEKIANELRRLAEQAEKAGRAQRNAVMRRGEAVWNDVETEIERRNAVGYDNAARLRSDLREIAQADRKVEDFRRRLRAIRERHARKGRFIERLAKLG